MEKFFKIGRGDFFGILIPGAFLLFNLYLIYLIDPNSLDLFGLANYVDKFNNSVVFYILFLILSYIIGFALRLINPNIIDAVSGHICYYYNQIRKLLHQPYFDFPMHKMKFPYIDWFLRENSGQPDSIIQFYKHILEREFSGQIARMRHKDFINSCKLYICEKAGWLRDEIVFCEGIVRFSSGIIWVLLINIIVLIKTGNISPLVWVYVILFLIFIWKFRALRGKEAATIYHSYALIVQENKKKLGRSK